MYFLSNVEFSSLKIIRVRKLFDGKTIVMILQYWYFKV